MEMMIGYVFLSLVVGILGRKTYIGFWGNFIFALFLSPVIPLIYVLLTEVAPRKESARSSRSNER